MSYGVVVIVEIKHKGRHTEALFVKHFCHKVMLGFQSHADDVMLFF